MDGVYKNAFLRWFPLLINDDFFIGMAHKNAMNYSWIGNCTVMLSVFLQTY